MGNGSGKAWQDIFCVVKFSALTLVAVGLGTPICPGQHSVPCPGAGWRSAPGRGLSVGVCIRGESAAMSQFSFISFEWHLPHRHGCRQAQFFIHWRTTLL